MDPPGLQSGEKKCGNPSAGLPQIHGTQGLNKSETAGLPVQRIAAFGKCKADANITTFRPKLASGDGH